LAKIADDIANVNEPLKGGKCPPGKPKDYLFFLKLQMFLIFSFYIHFNTPNEFIDSVSNR
jgi:hypothetical protein